MCEILIASNGHTLMYILLYIMEEIDWNKDQTKE